jgi:hypothetical protein
MLPKPQICYSQETYTSSSVKMRSNPLSMTKNTAENLLVWSDYNTSMSTGHYIPYPVIGIALEFEIILFMHLFNSK